MAIFGFKKRKDDKLEQKAQSTKAGSRPASKTVRAPRKKAEPKTNKAIVAKTSGIAKTSGTPLLGAASFSGATAVIIRPHVTEKSGIMSQMGVYTFQVTQGATKPSIAAAIRSLYKVTPVSVGIVNLPMKNIIAKGRKGTVSGVRKAIVTVKKGEKIDFV